MFSGIVKFKHCEVFIRGKHLPGQTISDVEQESPEEFEFDEVLYNGVDIIPFLHEADFEELERLIKKLRNDEVSDVS